MTSRRMYVLIAVGLVLAASVPVARELHHRATLSCTNVGGISAVWIEVDPQARSSLTTLRVRLDQGRRSREITFPATSSSRYGSYIQPGVSVDRNVYFVDLGDGMKAALPGPWDAHAPAAVTVEGLIGSLVAYRRDERFRFALSYPNGKECDPEAFRHRMRLT